MKPQEERGTKLLLACNKTPLKRNYNTEEFGNKKLVFYLTHPQDRKSVFPTFVILDFHNYEKTYLTSYLSANTEKIKNSYSEDFLRYGIQPHHALTHNENKDFYAFMYQNTNFFYKVDYQNNTARLITTQDIGLAQIKSLGDTFNSNAGIIHFSGVLNEGENWKVKLYKADLNFNNIQEEGEYSYRRERAPHTTLYHKDLIINVHLLNSEIVVYNPFNKEITTYQTSGFATGHIETSGDFIYVSNHNFRWESAELSFKFPATIDKFLVQDGKLIHRGYFMDKGGFRFTSHKIFQYNGIEYMVTIGHPNRLYIIRTSSMALEYFDTIGKDIFPANEDPISYINREGQYVSDFIKPVEACAGYITLISLKYVIIYSFSEKRIVQIIPINEDIKVAKDINVKEFFQNSSHTNLIE